MGPLAHVRVELLGVDPVTTSPISFRRGASASERIAVFTSAWGAGGAYGDVFDGRVQLLLDPLFSSMPHVKSGRLKPIAVMGLKRDPSARESPAAAEMFPDFDFASNLGIGVPRGTPPEIIAKITGQGIRNPGGHEIELSDDPDVCLDHLAFASLTAVVLDCAHDARCGAGLVATLAANQRRDLMLLRQHLRPCGEDPHD